MNNIYKAKYLKLSIFALLVMLLMPFSSAQQTNVSLQTEALA